MFHRHNLLWQRGSFSKCRCYCIHTLKMPVFSYQGNSCGMYWGRERRKKFDYCIFEFFWRSDFVNPSSNKTQKKNPQVYLSIKFREPTWLLTGILFSVPEEDLLYKFLQQQEFYPLMFPYTPHQNYPEIGEKNILSKQNLHKSPEK